MTWPAWLQHLAETYLRDEASVFLLHGPGVARGRWRTDGNDEDIYELLTRFLARTRPVVGVQRPNRALTFPGIGDVGAFERIVAASALISGTQLVLRDDTPDQAAAKIWIALSSAEPSQGYLIGELRALAPDKKERPPLAGNTPHLEAWCSAERIRGANHVVVLLTPQLDGIHRELIQTSHVIRVPEPTATATPPPLPEPLESMGTQSTPAPEPESIPTPAAGELLPELESEICAQLAAMDESMRPAKIPVLAAVAEVVRRRTGSPGVLQWSIDEDGNPQAAGPDAQAFLERWKADITLDAAASRLMGALDDAAEGTLEPVGMRVLTKRLGRWLEPS